MKKILRSLVILLTIPLCSVAQTDTIAGKTHHLREVTISKDRHQRALQSTAPMHVMDRRDMLVQGVTDMADALHRLPGITLRDYGGAGGMKTVSVRGFGAKHTGVSYDGVMLSECQSGEIDLSRYSLDNVDHLSLVVGDNDDIFIPARQSSTPAVLHIETLRVPSEDLQPHLTTQLKLGSFGYVNPFMRYEQNVSNRFAFSAVGDAIYAENDFPYTIPNYTETVSDRRVNSRMKSGRGELNFIWNVSNASRLSGKAYYYDNDRQLPGQVRYYTNESHETLRDRNAFGQLLFQSHHPSGWSVKGIFKQNWIETIYKNGAYFGSTAVSSYWQRETSFSACVLYTPNHHWAFDYSGDYIYNSLNTNTVQVNHPWRHGILQSLTAKWMLPRLTLTGRVLSSIYLNGIKEGQSARDMRKVSPSLSLSYKPFEAEDLYVRASMKNIFRVPTFNESYYFHYGSSDLLSESTNQYNIGATFSKDLFSNLAVHCSVDGYYNQVKDMIVAIPYNMFVWRCVNIGKVDVYGVDATLNATWRLAEGHLLSGHANYSYQKVENKTNPESPNFGKQIAYYPQHTGGASVSYENPWVNLSVHFVAVSDRWATNEHLEETKVKGYQDVGVRLWRDVAIGKHQIGLRADVKNLLNKQYEIVRLYPMPGRSYYFTLTYKY